MLRAFLLEQQLQPRRLLVPWLFPVLAGWLLLHHGFLATIVKTDGSWTFEPPMLALGLLGLLAALQLAWTILRQMGWVAEHSGTGFLLCGFAIWVIVWVDTMRMILVDLPPQHLTPEQFGPIPASLCLYTAYLAYAVGVLLVIRAATTSLSSRQSGRPQRTHAPQ